MIQYRKKIYSTIWV